MKHSVVHQKLYLPHSWHLAVVLASFSFKIEQHFCGSNLVDVSVLYPKLNLAVQSWQLKKTNTSKDYRTIMLFNISVSVVEGFENYQTRLLLQSLLHYQIL